MTQPTIIGVDHRCVPVFLDDVGAILKLGAHDPQRRLHRKPHVDRLPAVIIRVGKRPKITHDLPHARRGVRCVAQLVEDHLHVGPRLARLRQKQQHFAVR